MKHRYALPTAGALFVVLSAIFTPFMKHGIDAGLTNDAKAALVSKGVSGVGVNSDWASLNLKGPESARTAALAAVHKMGNVGAVNTVKYICTGPVPCPAGSAGSSNGSGSGASAAGASAAPSSSASSNGSAAGSGSGSTGSKSGNAGSKSGSGNGSSSSSGSGASGSGSGSGSGSAPAGVKSTAKAGTPAAKKEASSINAEIIKTLGSAGVTFNTGSSTLTSQGKSVLNHVASLLGEAPNLKVAIAGYTDNQGSASLNLALSKSRAKATESYLAAHGVAANRMTANGYGEADPVATNSTAAGRAANRRIKFTVQGG